MIVSDAVNNREPVRLALTMGASVHGADELMAAIVAKRLVEHLERSGFVCGMSFGRWIEQAPYLAQCGVLARSPHASRLAALPSRLQHAAAELFRGTMVSHSFIANCDDTADDSQPIAFTRDTWRDYIPIRLPRLRHGKTQASSPTPFLSPLDGVRSGTSASWAASRY